MRRVYRDEGLTSLIVYVMILAVVAMLSLLVILNLFMTVPVNEQKIEVGYYQNDIMIHNLTCTLVDSQGYAYYDTQNYPKTLDVYVMRNGKPAAGLWVTMSGCGITSEASKTGSDGYAHFNLRGVHLNPGEQVGYLNFKISGKTYHLKVVRG